VSTQSDVFLVIHLVEECATGLG